MTYDSNVDWKCLYRQLTEFSDLAWSIDEELWCYQLYPCGNGSSLVGSSETTLLTMRKSSSGHDAVLEARDTETWKLLWKYFENTSVRHDYLVGGGRLQSYQCSSRDVRRGTPIRSENVVIKGPIREHGSVFGNLTLFSCFYSQYDHTFEGVYVERFQQAAKPGPYTSSTLHCLVPPFHREKPHRCHAVHACAGGLFAVISCPNIEGLEDQDKLTLRCYEPDGDFAERWKVHVECKTYCGEARTYLSNSEEFLIVAMGIKRIYVFCMQRGTQVFHRDGFASAAAPQWLDNSRFLTRAHGRRVCIFDFDPTTGVFEFSRTFRIAAPSDVFVISSDIIIAAADRHATVYDLKARKRISRIALPENEISLAPHGRTLNQMALRNHCLLLPLKNCVIAPKMVRFDEDGSLVESCYSNVQQQR